MPLCIPELSHALAPVCLVGAGPGHIEYISLRGLRALQSAEVIVYDALIDKSFLSHFPANAKKIYVGKRSGKHACSQSDIQKILVEEASHSKRVVRLKGGDPLVFGRGGEEVLALHEAGVEVEVIPGITSAQGAAANFLIPLTHRQQSRGFLVIEGHAAFEAGLPYKSLADFPGTLVFYMAQKNMQSIASHLLAEGMSPGTPVARISSVLRVDAALERYSLSDFYKTELEKNATPTLFMVGKALEAIQSQAQFLELPLAEAV